MWTGQAIIQPGCAVFVGTAGDHTPHRHHAVQIAIGMRGPVKLWAQVPGAISAAGVVIAADHPHQLADGPEPLALLYLERESVAGRSLDDWCAGRARTLTSAKSALIGDLLQQAHQEMLPAMLDQVLAIILGSKLAQASAAFSDARIADSVASLPRPLPERLTVAQLAQQVGLSVSRYAHLFRAHTGMPLRPYLRWLRLQQALLEVARGARLTEAAHTAGFADSAHLSRSFRSTFGIAPQVLRNPALLLKTKSRES